jgi:lysophospholipase L1-like esterase
MSQLMIFGDSITAGAWDQQGGWAARLIANLHQRNIDDDSFYCMSYNLGISGDCMADVTKRMYSELEARHDSDEQLVLVLAIGTNDSQYLINESRINYTPEQFKVELEKFSKLAASVQARVLILGPGPAEEAKVDPMPWATDKSYRNQNIKLLNEVLVEWSAEYQYPFINLYEQWIDEDYKAKLCDGIHPNTRGHEEIFEMVLRAINEYKLFA